MAKIQSTIVRNIKFGDEPAKFTARQPTNKEYNEYLADKSCMGSKSKKELQLHHDRARVNLFDKIITKIEDLEDETGPVTLERLDAVPLPAKVQFIAATIDDIEIEEVDPKNS